METQRGRTKIEDVVTEIRHTIVDIEKSSPALTVSALTVSFLQLEVLLDIRELLQNMENGTTVRSKWGSKL